MLTETSAGNTVAAVVQDALTGEILWVGHLGTDVPKRIAETGIVRTPGLADGEPIAVRHLSSSGEGLVIHVEGPSTRYQMDSMLPEPSPSFSQTDLLELSQTLAARRDSGKWAKTVSPNPSETNGRAAANLEAYVQAFELIKNSGKTEAIAERAAAVLWSLLEELKDAQVPLAMTLDAFGQRRER
jgi:hypothetical protein